MEQNAPFCEISSTSQIQTHSGTETAHGCLRESLYSLPAAENETSNRLFQPSTSASCSYRNPQETLPSAGLKENFSYDNAYYQTYYNTWGTNRNWSTINNYSQTSYETVQTNNQVSLPHQTREEPSSTNQIQDYSDAQFDLLVSCSSLPVNPIKEEFNQTGDIFIKSYEHNLLEEQTKDQLPNSLSCQQQFMNPSSSDTLDHNIIGNIFQEIIHDNSYTTPNITSLTNTTITTDSSSTTTPITTQNE